MAASSRYHHGDLRRSLVEAGLNLLEESGAEAVTLRATARRAGVSHAAPYHHFASKAHLIEELAVQGFDVFTETLRRARDASLGDALERLQATGVAYVSFATSRPALFRLMNRPELRAGTADSRPPSVRVERAAHASYRVLEETLRDAQDAGLIEPGDLHRYAVAAWSLVHGVAVLVMDGLLEGRDSSPEEAERLAQVATGVLGRGLLRR